MHYLYVVLSWCLDRSFLRHLGESAYLAKALRQTGLLQLVIVDYLQDLT